MSRDQALLDNVIFQRNQFADSSAMYAADLVVAKERIAELEAKVAELTKG